MARSFNGTSDIITVGTPSVLNITSAITLSAWIYPTAFPAAGSNFELIIDKGYDGTNGAYSLRLGGTKFDGSQNGNFLQVTTFANGVTSGSQVVFNESLNTWTHVLGQADGSLWHIYQNGSNSGEDNALNSSGTPVSSTEKVALGGGYLTGTATRFWPGRIADAAIWNIALTQTEITALSHGTRPYLIRPTALKGWWPLDGLVSPEVDLSGNANNGTLTGTSLAFGAPFLPFTPRWPIASSFTLPPPLVPGGFAAAEW